MDIVFNAWDDHTTSTRRWLPPLQPMRTSLPQLAPALASWPNVKKSENLTDTPPHQPYPIHPRVHWATRIPSTEVHQIPIH